jgi:hypothetical protein
MAEASINMLHQHLAAELGTGTIPLVGIIQQIK